MNYNFLKILFQENYSARVKFIIDFIFLLLIYFALKNSFGLSIIYSEIFTVIIYTIFPSIVIALYGSHNSLFRYTSIIGAIKVIYGLISAYLVILVLNILLKNQDYLNQILFFFLSSYFLIAFRFMIKFIYQKISLEVELVDNFMIFGAGNNGIITKRAFYNSPRYRIKGFIDDDKSKINKEIDGVNVFKLGPKLLLFIEKHNVKK